MGAAVPLVLGAGGGFLGAGGGFLGAAVPLRGKRPLVAALCRLQKRPCCRERCGPLVCLALSRPPYGGKKKAPRGEAAKPSPPSVAPVGRPRRPRPTWQPPTRQPASSTTARHPCRPARPLCPALAFFVSARFRDGQRALPACIPALACSMSRAAIVCLGAGIFAASPRPACPPAAIDIGCAPAARETPQPTTRQPSPPSVGRVSRPRRSPVNVPTSPHRPRRSPVAIQNGEMAQSPTPSEKRAQWSSVAVCRPSCSSRPRRSPPSVATVAPVGRSPRSQRTSEPAPEVAPVGRTHRPRQSPPSVAHIAAHIGASPRGRPRRSPTSPPSVAPVGRPRRSSVA